MIKIKLLQILEVILFFMEEYLHLLLQFVYNLYIVYVKNVYLSNVNLIKNVLFKTKKR